MVTNIKHICFDLDGTLIDSHKTIYNATIKSLFDLNVSAKIDEEIFREKIGMHFVDIFDDMNIHVHDFEKFIKIYKNNYFSFIEDSIFYSDAEAVLSEFSSQGFKLSLLTTKAQDQAEIILEHFNISKYFDLIMGRRNGIEHKPSPEPLLQICKELSVSPAESLIVGDTELDILCGQNANTKTCAIIHGYRTEKSLATYKPDFIVKDLKELKKLLVK